MGYVVIDIIYQSVAGRNNVLKRPFALTQNEYFILVIY